MNMFYLKLRTIFFSCVFPCSLPSELLDFFVCQEGREMNARQTAAVRANKLIFHLWARGLCHALRGRLIR